MNTKSTATANLHPWNTDFTWEDRAKGPLQVLSAAEAVQFDRDGYVVLHDVFEPAEIEALCQEIDRFEAELDALLHTVDDGRLSIAEAGAITFTTHLVTKSDLVRRFSRHPLIAGLCADLVGEDVNLYWDQAVYKKPEKPRRFPWHQDNGYAFVEPQQYLTCWVPLTDATVDNGCPQVAVGRHRDGTLRHTFVDPLGWECFTDPEDVAVAEVRVGGVVVFSSLTPHLTGPNTTDSVRKAYILQYAPAGAEVLDGDPTADDEPTRTAADDRDRQYPVTRDGAPTEIEAR